MDATQTLQSEPPAWSFRVGSGLLAASFLHTQCLNSGHSSMIHSCTIFFQCLNHWLKWTIDQGMWKWTLLSSHCSSSSGKWHFLSSLAELVPVPGPAQLPGSFGPVWDWLHGGLGLYSLSLLQSLSTHHCLISSPEWESGQELERGSVPNTNDPPHQDVVLQAFLELLCA